MFLDTMSIINSNPDYTYHLPDDIIINILPKFLGFKDIYNLSRFVNYKTITQEYELLFDNDKELYEVFIECLRYVGDSSFSLDVIFEIMDHIRYEECFSHINIEPKSCNINDINTTFYIFQIIGKYAYIRDYNPDTVAMITNILVSYFKKVFVKKYNINKNEEFEKTHNLIMSMFHNDNIKWYSSSVNMYYIYANIVIMMVKKVEIKNLYKNTREADKYMIHDPRISNLTSTLSMILATNAIFNQVNIRVFTIFETFRMINYMCHNGDNKIIKNNRFIKCTLEKIVDIKEEIKKKGLNHRIRSFKKIIHKELEKSSSLLEVRQ